MSVPEHIKKPQPVQTVYINPTKFKKQLSIYSYKQEKVFEAHTEKQEGMVEYRLVPADKPE